MKMKGNFNIVLILFLAVFFSCKGNLEKKSSEPDNGKIPSTLDYAALVEQASFEYQEPIRPGYEQGNPWWNGYAPRFLYAPAFNLPKVTGAVRYRFSIKLTPASGAAETYTFDAPTPTSPLSPIWNDIKPGKAELTVTGLDENNHSVGTSGQKSFVRDVPYKGKYPNPARTYKWAAVQALRYIHTLPAIQSWKTSTTPDLSLSQNAYPCKIAGSTVSIECLVAKYLPEYKTEALSIAKHAAEFLINQSRPSGEPLAFFPPTYYGDKLAAGKAENKDKTMMMEAATAGMAFLDLYNATGDKTYLNRAISIADTYLDFQSVDGSFPIKVDIITGEPVYTSKALLTPLLEFWDRLDKEYGRVAYRNGLAAAEKWMDLVAIPAFDMSGQFEDVTVNVAPYSNLTECTAAPYASWLLHRDNITLKAKTDALDLIRMSEDQFVHWDEYINAKWNICPPCVFEQFRYQTPVDNSACVMANAWIDWYLYSGDKLAWAKAKALVDNIVNLQDTNSGMIPTTWDEYPSRTSRSLWVNCLLNSVNTLLRMDALTSGNAL